MQEIQVQRSRNQEQVQDVLIFLDHDDMTTMTTPTTKGWRSDVSIITLGWRVTLVGPGQHPRYSGAV